MRYEQSDALIKQIHELQTPVHAPEMWSNAPEAVELLMEVSGGVPLTGVSLVHGSRRASMPCQ